MNSLKKLVWSILLLMVFLPLNSLSSTAEYKKILPAIYLLLLEQEDEFVSTLNDTGMTWSGDYPSGNQTTCNSNIPYQQDCHQGRDATDNDDSDGSAGFSFTKINATGGPLAASASEWACVEDNVTGLMWEIKTNDVGGGLQDKDHRYHWYNTDPLTNGGSEGTLDNLGNICHGYDSTDPSTFCNTQNYTAQINGTNLCGYSDWRMPTREELRSIVDYSKKGPSIDISYFPNVSFSSSKTQVYWTSTPYTPHGGGAFSWVVSFHWGWSYGDWSYPGYDRYIRLVRDAK